jgi:predicted porin
MVRGLGLRSRLLVAAGVTLFMGAYPHAPAKAADLGGDCCSDLEERIAELEATTVRKGNKKVSVTLYGKLNKAVVFWDDGAEKNTYVVDNNYESSRFGLKGSAKIGGKWSAGYRLEAENLSGSSNLVNQLDDDDGTRSGGVLGNESRLLLLRHSYAYIDNKDWGQVRMGLTPTPIYNITKDTNVTEIEDTMHSDNRMNQGFFLRPKGANTEAGLSRLKWQDISRCYGSSNAFVCSTRRNGVAYWSPEWYGFTASWGWFEDDIWGGALRYKKEWGELFEVGAGVGYEKYRDENIQNSGGGLAGFKRDINEWAGSGSIKHLPTGLYFFGAFSFSDNNDSNRQSAGVFDGKSSPEMSAYDLQIGVQRKFAFLGLDRLGDTTLFGGYSNINDGIGGAGGATRSLPAGTFVTVPVQTEITGADVKRWYIGYDQAVDAAGTLHLYGVYQHFEADVDLIDASLARVNAPLDDFQLFYTGARLDF